MVEEGWFRDRGMQVEGDIDPVSSYPEGSSRRE
jgi:hypothetical protein